jgi:tetratricopeptide (TPR) repeat protein
MTAEALVAPRGAAARWRTPMGVAVLVAAIAGVYSRSLDIPFIFDDLTSIPENPNIQTLWPPWRAMSPPPQLGAAGGRPLVGLTLAVNYALGGLNVRGYHLFNVLVHVLAALALWGALARTLASPRVRGRFGGQGAAFAVALVWSVHPLLTEPVAYVVQRTELLMGLFYLLTLYASLRAWDSARPGRWEAAAVGACALGMACKEVMVSAPVMVMLHDLLLRGEPWRALVRRRGRLYLGLGATWAVLAAILAGGAQIKGALGGASPISPLAYLWLQAQGIVHYLRLCLWPRPLRLAYDWSPPTLLQGLPYALLLLGLVAGAVAARRKRPWLTFAACWFFLILAPTSSVLPLYTETLAERRMYLPSAAVVALVVLGVRAALVRVAAPRGGTVLPVAAAAVAAAVAALGWLSWQRLGDYRSVLAIWTDTAAKAPRSPVARNNLGMALALDGRIDEALAHFREALAIDPGRALSHYNIGFTLSHQGKPGEAIGYLRESLRLHPADADAHFALGVALAATGERAGAARAFEESLALRPQDAEAHRELANALVAEGDLGAAGRHLEESLRLDPGDFRTHSKYGNLLTAVGRHAEAAAHYREALRLQPQDARTRNNLATSLLQTGRAPEAVAELERALRDDPRYALGHYNLANVLSGSGRAAEGAGHYLEAIRFGGTDARLREAAGQKLAEVAAQSPEAARVLAAASQDPDPAVREAARRGSRRRVSRSTEDVPGLRR